MSIEKLENDGYLVINPKWLNIKSLKNIRKQMDLEINRFPEFTSTKGDLVLGGFKALNNPSSFHNLFVRKMRACAMLTMVPVFKEYIDKLENSESWKLEQVIDRMMLRPKGVSASAESWHRDEAKLALDDDKIFGGWWNFNDESQYFSCVPGTHKGIVGHSGFAAIKDKKEIELLKNKKVLVEIPAGCIMIFYEQTIHEVLAKKSKTDIYRLFLGWRVTKSSKSLYPIQKLLNEQGVMPLKSGQMPPMYATLHWTNWREKIVDFSSNINPKCLEMKKVESGKDKGKEYKIVERYLKSLAHYGFKMYRPYNEQEIGILLPSREWTVNCFGYDQVLTLN